MITKTLSYQSSDGAVHATVEAAQVAELKLISRTSDGEETAESGPRAEWIVENRVEVLAILGTKARKKRTSTKIAAAKSAKVKPAVN